MPDEIAELSVLDIWRELYGTDSNGNARREPFLRKDGHLQFNIFRDTNTGRLDKKFLRICAVHRLMLRGRIDTTRAIVLLEERHIRNARATVECWTKEGHVADFKVQCSAETTSYAPHISQNSAPADDLDIFD